MTSRFIGVLLNRKGYGDFVGKLIFGVVMFLGLSAFIALYRSESKIGIDLSEYKDKLVLVYPKFGLFVGIIGSIVFICVMLGFTLFSSELPHIIFYIVFGFFLLVGIYLILKTKNFKLIVEDDEQIIVYSLINTIYTFGFQDIRTVVRQTKKNGAERMVIKTNNKKVIVEYSAIGYEQFKRLIESKVNHNKLYGFEE